MALHIGIAQVAKAPEMILEEGEAKMLADPLARIAEDFDFVPDPRIMNAIALIGAAGMVYGPRIVNIRERLKEEAKAKRPPGQVINFPPLRSAGKTDPQPVPDPKAPPMAQTEPPPIDPALDAANGFRHIPPELNA